ncbi:MAG: 3'-5' exonuclease, partial [Candidatus Cloacimonadales bacterium]
ERGMVSNIFYEQLVSRFRFLLIDEFQDTSLNQFSILYPIIQELISGRASKDYAGVIVVGDPKQSIYGWRDGERGILMMMPSILNVEAEDLSQCFRSTKPVIDIINRVFTDADFQKQCYEDVDNWDYSEVKAKNWDPDLQQYREDKEQGGELFYWENNSQAPAASDEEEEEDEANLTSYQKFALQIKSLLTENKITCHDTAILVRTGKQADAIAAELNNIHVPNNIESSGKLLEHKAVVFLLAVLKYKLLQDRYSLLHFLRSDVVLLSPEALTSILEIFHNHNAKSPANEELELLKQLPECHKLISLCEANYTSFAQFIQQIIANYDFSLICKNEIDWKNIYTFLELIISFEMAKLPSESFDLYGFLQYCQNQQEKESEILQEGLQLADSITILTIHKSKGLGFKNVFLYWNLSNRGNNERGQAYKFIYSFNEKSYHQLTDFVIYSKSDEKLAIELSGITPLIADDSQRELIEAIDVFYVALTRAGQKLGLFLNYKSKKDFSTFMDDLKGEGKMISKLILAYKAFFMENDGECQITDSLAYYSYNAPNLTNQSDQKSPAANEINSEKPKFYLKDFLNKYQTQEFAENRLLENMKQIYLQDRHQLYGNVAHEYLTYIKYGDEVEHKLARNMVLKQYGSLLPKQDLEAVINSCQSFVATHEAIFSRKWDKVFNEKTVFHHSQEYRIDRIMVCTATKEVVIIDYKTGGIEDKEQVARYIEIIKLLPYVTQHNYNVKGEYVSVYIES